MAAHLGLGLPARVAGYRCSWSFGERATAKVHGELIGIVNLIEFSSLSVQS